MLTEPDTTFPSPVLKLKSKSKQNRYILGSGGTLLFDVTIVAQSFLYKGRKPLDPPLSSASGYLPPRSVGVSRDVSVHGDTATGLSRSGTLRSRRAGTGGSGIGIGDAGAGTSSISRLGSLKSRLARSASNLATGAGSRGNEYGGDAPERAPLLPVVESLSSSPNYGS